MNDQPTKKKLQDIGERVAEQIPGIGFILVSINFNDPAGTNWATNIPDRYLMIALEQVLERLKNK